VHQQVQIKRTLNVVWGVFVISMNTNVIILIFFVIFFMGLYFIKIRLRLIALNIQNIIEGTKKRVRFVISPRLSDKMQYLDYFKDKKNNLVYEAELKNYIKKKSIEYKFCKGYWAFASVVGVLMAFCGLLGIIYNVIGKK